MVTERDALDYLANGLPIFPIKIWWEESEKKWKKKPLVKWLLYQTRIPTKEEVSEWFSDLKPDGLGMATGKLSGYVVLDVEGYAEISDYEDVNSKMIVNTISGGKHFYYRWTKELRNTVKIRGKAIDFRGDGGYIVLPPSGKGDKKYSWGKPHVPSMYLDPIPEKIEEELVSETSQPIVFQDGEMPFPPSVEGERNNEAARISGYLCTTIPRKLLEISGWETLKKWNFTNNPPLREDELRRTWESIKSTDYRKHPGRITNGIEIFDGILALSEYKKMMTANGHGLSTGFPELDEYFSMVPGNLYLVSAPTHHGKTTLTLNMAARMAVNGSRVLFCSLEQGVSIAPRIESMLGGPYPENLSILTSNKLMTATDISTAVNSMIYRPECLFVDHLHFMAKGDNDRAGAIEDMIITLQQLAFELKMPIVVIAHIRKLNGRDIPTLDDLKDSSSLAQVPSVVMLLKQDENKDVSDMVKYKKYLTGSGMLMIMKNRVTGKTGAEMFILKDNGRFYFGKTDYYAAKEVKWGQ